MGKNRYSLRSENRKVDKPKPRKAVLYRKTLPQKISHKNAIKIKYTIASAKMFPTHLHKNILQLDRQISLLESECKSMETDQRKKTANSKQPHKCSKASNTTVKSTLKKSSGYNYDGVKRTKKSTPISSLYSSSSLPSNCSKPCSGTCESLLPNRTRQCRAVSEIHICPCQADRASCSSRKENKCGNFVCGKSAKKDSEFSNDKKNHVLHKEVLFSNPGGTIEVTVTQKPNVDNHESNVPFTKRTLPKKELDSCDCHSRSSEPKGQKWSEILRVNASKQKDMFSSVSTVNEDLPNELFNKESAVEHYNKEKSSPRKESSTPPQKLVRQSSKAKKSCSELEKEPKTYIQNQDFRESLYQTDGNPIKMFQFLINELKNKTNEEERKKFLCDMEVLMSKLVPQHPPNLLTRSSEEDFLLRLSDQKDDFFATVKKLCDNLIKEKEMLSEELTAKDKTIATLKKREEEYLSLITSLKLNLEKTKQNAQEGINALKELGAVKTKFLEQIKVSEALKKSHTKMQEVLEKCALENDKLKTQIQIYRLESQKHDVLLAGKEAEIRRYKEEIESFQRQISEHLASLKSNAQAIDIEKMMEAIMQQSQLFSQADLDSVILEKEDRDFSIRQNGLLHSSPTSTKTSVVNSSWKQISSIREKDITKPKTNHVVANDDEEKEFIQVFGSDLFSESSKKTPLKEALIDKGSGKRPKKSSSFTSCLSVRDDNVSESDDTTSNEEVITDRTQRGNGVKKQLSSEKVRSSIDELLENMKLKWSKEIYGTSPGSGTIDDFFNGSQISSVSVNSRKVPSLEILK